MCCTLFSFSFEGSEDSPDLDPNGKRPPKGGAGCRGQNQFQRQPEFGFQSGDKSQYGPAAEQ